MSPVRRHVCTCSCYNLSPVQQLLSPRHQVALVCGPHCCPVCVQTRGAVRDSTKLAQAAFWYKVYIAAAAASAEQAFEVSLLTSALRLLEVSLLDALPAVWAASGQASRDAFDAQQMRNATCLCGVTVESLLAGTPYYTGAAAYATNCTGGLAPGVSTATLKLQLPGTQTTKG